MESEAEAGRLQRYREMVTIALMESDLNPVPEIQVGDSPLSHLDMIHRGEDYPKDPFLDDQPLACGVENPTSCETCQ